jgi:hypothetical protein
MSIIFCKLIQNKAQFDWATGTKGFEEITEGGLSEK